MEWRELSDNKDEEENDSPILRISECQGEVTVFVRGDRINEATAWAKTLGEPEVKNEVSNK